MLSRRNCKGSESYISREAASSVSLPVKSSKTCITWITAGKGLDRRWPRTKCVVVDDTFLEDCDVALGEDCRLDDNDDIQDEVLGQGPGNELQPGNFCEFAIYL